MVCLLVPALAWAAPDKPPERRPPERRKAAPPSRPTPLLPDKTKPKQGVWKRLKKGVGDLVPKPVKKGWDNASKKWKQARDLYEAMKKFAGWDEKTLRKNRIAAKKRAVLERWQRADERAEKKVLAAVRLLLWKRACQSGSARACRGWLNVAPKHPLALRRLRDILWRRKQWKQLAPLCARLQRSKQPSFSTKLCHAQATLGQKKRKQAQKMFVALSKAHPERGVVWLTLCRESVQDGRVKEAKQACQKAAERMPKDAETHLFFGKMWELAKAPKQATKAYAIACDGGLLEACRRIRDMRPKGIAGAWTWSRMNTRINALRVSRATRQNSCYVGIQRACRGIAEGHRTRAKQLLLYLRPLEAEWQLRKSVEVAPFDYRAWRAVALHLLKRKQWWEGCIYVKGSLKRKVQQPLLWRYAGMCEERDAKSINARVKEAYTKACALGDNRACLKINFGKPKN